MWSIIQRATSYFKMTNENQIVTPEYPINPLELLGEKQFERQTHFSDEIGSPVQEFFRDATVFITGGTGFLGKSLIEKMLRSCPHIKHIYLLIRDKKGQSSQERLKIMLQNRVRYSILLNLKSTLEPSHFMFDTFCEFFSYSIDSNKKLATSVIRFQ